MSYDNLIDHGEVPSLKETTDRDRLLGLIGAVKDGMVSEFVHQGFRVRRSGASVEVADEAETPLGGYMLIESASIEEIADWVEAKVEHYGDN